MAIDSGPGMTYSESGKEKPKPKKEIKQNDRFHIVMPSQDSHTHGNEKLKESEKEDWEDEPEEEKDDEEDEDEDVNIIKPYEPRKRYRKSRFSNLFSFILPALVLLIFVAVTSTVISNVTSLVGIENHIFGQLIDLIFPVILILIFVSVLVSVVSAISASARL